jgi:hypothetical protein
VCFAHWPQCCWRPTAPIPGPRSSRPHRCLSPLAAAGQAAASLAPELTYAADTLLATALGHGLLDLPKWALPPDPHDTGEGDYGTP